VGKRQVSQRSQMRLPGKRWKKT